jgi:hypothetical protein
MVRSGRCTELLNEKVSKEECCASDHVATAWSSEDLDAGTLFFWRVLGGGVPCYACKGGRHNTCMLSIRQLDACKVSIARADTRRAEPSARVYGRLRNTVAEVSSNKVSSAVLIKAELPLIEVSILLHGHWGHVHLLHAFRIRLDLDCKFCSYMYLIRAGIAQSV